MKYLDQITVNDKPVMFFSTPEKAGEHIRNHLLSSPECYAWAIIYPDDRFKNLVQLDEHRVKMAHEILKTFITPSLCGHWLYDYYLDAANHEIVKAISLGWVAVDAFSLSTDDIKVLGDGFSFDIPENKRNVNDTIVMMSPVGAFIVIQNSYDHDTQRMELRLTSFYIGGQGSREKVNDSKENSQSPLPREMSTEIYLRDRRNQKPKTRYQTKREIEVQIRRENKYSLEEYIFYKLFRPARQWMREQHWTSSKPDSEVWTGKHAALLKKKVDVNSYEKWLEKYLETTNNIKSH